MKFNSDLTCWVFKPQARLIKLLRVIFQSRFWCLSASPFLYQSVITSIKWPPVTSWAGSHPFGRSQSHPSISIKVFGCFCWADLWYGSTGETESTCSGVNKQAAQSSPSFGQYGLHYLFMKRLCLPAPSSALAAQQPARPPESFSFHCFATPGLDTKHQLTVCVCVNFWASRDVIKEIKSWNKFLSQVWLFTFLK